MGDELHLSVVIPAYNEEERLKRFVPGIISHLQSRDLRFEIVVVNDGSKDNTLALASASRRKFRCMPASPAGAWRPIWSVTAAP